MAALNKLSAKGVEAIRKGKKVGKHSDGGGLYLQVTEAGGCYWRYKYHLAGAEKLYAIGTLDDFTLAEAREEHLKARKLVMAGDDPVQSRRDSKAEKEAERAAARPFREIATEWLEAMVPAGASKSTKDRTVRLVNKMSESFGDVGITEVEVSHLAKVLATYEAEGKFSTRERAQGVATKIGGYCVGRGYIKNNPFREVSFAEAFTSAGSVHTPRPALVDAKPFGQLLRHIDGSGEREINKLALRLLALIAVRPGELAKAKWTEIRIADKKMIVPAEMQKMRTQRKKAKDPRAGKDFEVPLSRQAIEEFQALHRLTGYSEYLFPVVRKRKNLKMSHMQVSNINDALNRLRYQHVHCAHGFRSTFSTIMNAERADMGGLKVVRWPEQKALIEVQLDHNDESTQAIYDRGGRWEERCELMQLWADHVDEMRDNDKPKLRLVA